MKHLYQLTIDGLTVYYDAHVDDLTAEEQDHVCHTTVLVEQAVDKEDQQAARLAERVKRMIEQGSKASK